MWGLAWATPSWAKSGDVNTTITTTRLYVLLLRRLIVKETEDGDILFHSGSTETWIFRVGKFTRAYAPSESQTLGNFPPLKADRSWGLQGAAGSRLEGGGSAPPGGPACLQWPQGKPPIKSRAAVWWNFTHIIRISPMCVILQRGVGGCCKKSSHLEHEIFFDVSLWWVHQCKVCNPFCTIVSPVWW